MRTYPQSKSPQNCNEKIPLVREGKHLKREGKKMRYTRIQAGRGFDIYRVTEGYHGLTYAEIADKIDCNNWGYTMVYICKDYIEIKIYTD